MEELPCGRSYLAFKFDTVSSPHAWKSEKNVK